jgi:hypothetical protein
MQKITTLIELREAIVLHEAHERDCRLELTTEIKKTIENFSPARFIHDKISNLVNIDSLKSILLQAGVTIATNFISRKYLNNEKATPVKRVMGVILQLATQSLVTRFQKKILNHQNEHTAVDVN